MELAKIVGDTGFILATDGSQDMVCNHYLSATDTRPCCLLESTFRSVKHLLASEVFRISSFEWRIPRVFLLASFRLRLQR